VATAEPHNDPTIPDDAILWRRIPPWHFFYDTNLGRMRPSSAAFEDDADGSPMSVVLAAETSGPENALAGHPGYALASFTAGMARECSQGVARDPLPHEPAHALVSGRRTGSVRNRLAKGSTWVVPPPNP
jgi:hypothetical protein